MDQTRMEFTTRAPADASETKGYRSYFHPEELVWRVGVDYVSVSAQGPSTRTRRPGRGNRGYMVCSERWGDETPEWLVVPWELIRVVQKAVGAVAAMARVASNGE